MLLILFVRDITRLYYGHADRACLLICIYCQIILCSKQNDLGNHLIQIIGYVNGFEKVIQMV